MSFFIIDFKISRRKWKRNIQINRSNLIILENFEYANFNTSTCYRYKRTESFFYLYNKTADHT